MKLWNIDERELLVLGSNQGIHDLLSWYISDGMHKYYIYTYVNTILYSILGPVTIKDMQIPPPHF